MPILALETATEACSAAIILDNGDVVSRYQLAPRLQTQLLLPMIDELFAEAQLTAAQLTAIAYSCGPGSFTGIRVAAAAAQGLAFGWDLPVLAISSLQTLAQTAYRQLAYQRVLAVFDARMNEIYLAAYQLEQGIMLPLSVETVCAPNNLPVLPDSSWPVVGNGAIYSEIIQQQCSIEALHGELHPHAHDVATLAQLAWHKGHAQAPELALPVYLRDSVWQKLPNK